MLSCTGCKRFLRDDADACPFCGSARQTAIAPLARAVAIGVALVACGPSVGVGDGDGGGGDTTTADDGSGTSPATTHTTTNTSANTTVATTMDPDTSTSTVSTSDDDATDDEGAAFYGGAPDGGGSIECDVWAQDCMEGHKCMPWANDGGDDWTATICSPVDGTPGAPGDPCTVGGNPYSGFDDCALGSMCWNVDPATNEGTCVANCSGSEASPSCEDENAHCMIAYDGLVHVCLPYCDPLLQDCPAAATCVGVEVMFFCVPDNSGPMGAVGDACEDFNDCDPGLFCADPAAVPDCAGAGCCAQFCDLAIADPTQCALAADGVQCVPWFEDGRAPPGSETDGACVIPM